MSAQAHTELREDVLRRVMALIRQSERTDNQHEAEAFADKAQELIGKYAISQAMIDSFRPPEQRQVPSCRKIRFSPNKSFTKQRAGLLNAVSRANRCKLVLTDDRHADCFGFEDDLSFVEMLFTSLVAQMTHAGERALRSHEADWGREDNRYAWRRNFYIGFVSGVAGALRRATQRVVAEARRRNPGQAELVLIGREAQVNELVTTVYPSLRSTRGSQVTNTSAYGAGRVEGVQADVTGGRVQDGAAGYVGRDRRALSGKR